MANELYYNSQALVWIPASISAQEVHNWKECGTFPLVFIDTAHLAFSQSVSDGDVSVSELPDEVRVAVNDGDYRNLLLKLGRPGISRLLGLRATAISSGRGTATALLWWMVPRYAYHPTWCAVEYGGACVGKHCGRLRVGWGTSYWGTEKEVMTGGDLRRNELANGIENTILDIAVWMNIHRALGGVKILELRVREGYGVRW